MNLRNLKKTIVTAISLTGFVIIICSIISLYLRSIDPSERLLENRANITSAAPGDTVFTDNSITYELGLASEKLPTLNCTIRIPESEKPIPAMILLGGVERGKGVIDLVAEVELASEFIFASFDYPYSGKMSKLSVLEFLKAVPAIREACFNTVPAILTLIDYLHTLEEVDKENIFVTGGSFGSFFAIAAASLDERIKASAALYGGGDISLLIKENTKEVPAFLRGTAGYLAESLLYPLEPLKHINNISPRHVLIVNGRNDSQVPRESVMKLYEKAGDPKELIWFESDHIHPTNKGLLAELTGVVAEWIINNGLIER